MRIKIDPKSLTQTTGYECAIRFALGGATTVLAGLVAKKFGPAVGGLFLAIPALFPASATLVEKHEREKKTQKGLEGEERGREAASLDALGASIGAVGLCVFAVTVWLLLPEHSAWQVLVGASMMWFVSSFALWFLREQRHKFSGFTPGAKHSPPASRT